MPTTTYAGFTDAVAVIGARTDDAGTAVADLTAEEARFPLIPFTEGKVTPTNSFKVNANSPAAMNVVVGSGTAKADYYLVAGEASGQGNYLVRLDDTTVVVTVPAAEPASVRTDELYLVVRDNAYDTSARAVPTFGYRKGDAGGANPGVDSSWKASALLARITVPAAASSIVAGNISDQRAQSTLISQGAGSGLDADLLDALQAYDFVQMFGRGGALSGSSPSSTTRIRMQAGTTVAATNATGELTITFPSAFATGLLSVLACPGDDVGTLVSIVVADSTGLSNFTIRCHQGDGAAVVSQTVRVNWMALGW
jgi:hypothetical protein